MKKIKTKWWLFPLSPLVVPVVFFATVVTSLVGKKALTERKDK
jgi:hypothetical protein